MSGALEKLVDVELAELGQYWMGRTRDLVNLKNVWYADDVLEAVENLAGDHHYVSKWLGRGVVYVNVSGLKSFSQIGEYLRAVKKVVPQIMIEDKKQQDLTYECWIGVFKFSFVANSVDATCRKVQVGTRTVEEPVYEIQCDGKPVVDDEE